MTITGNVTNNAREEARALIKRLCHANDEDALIFAGSGSTSGFNLLIDKLRLKKICEQIDASSKEGSDQSHVISKEELDKKAREVNFCE